MQTSAVSNNISSEKSYDLQDWQGGYKSLNQEFDYWIDDIEGEIPPELQGTFFKNGPGLFDINGQRFHHPFDGDGMISRITFTNGRAHFRNRFVHTAEYLAEQKAGKILYRGVFGTQKPGGWLANIFDLKVKEIANTNVIYWGGKLLALWEASLPYRLEADTLKTLGKEDFNGILTAKEAFSAHPRIDPSYQQDGEPRLVNFFVQPGTSTKITVVELNLAGEIVSKQLHTVPGFCFIHDFVITPNYCIFFQNPVKFNPLPYILGFSGAGQCIKLQPQQATKIIVIPRTNQNNSSELKILETKSGFIFHHANAYEVEQEIIIDSIFYEHLAEVRRANEDYLETDFDANAPGQLRRFTLNLTKNRVESNLLDSRAYEFPSIHPNYVGKKHRYIYSAAAHAETGNAPLQAIAKFDLQSQQPLIWSAAPRGFVGEPVFVPRPNSQLEDDGWLLTLVYDAAHHRSDVVILNAQDLQLVAKLHLKHHIPYGLHGSFTPEIFVNS